MEHEKAVGEEADQKGEGNEEEDTEKDKRVRACQAVSFFGQT